MILKYSKICIFGELEKLLTFYLNYFETDIFIKIEKFINGSLAHYCFVKINKNINKNKIYYLLFFIIIYNQIIIIYIGIYR